MPKTRSLKDAQPRPPLHLVPTESGGTTATATMPPPPPKSSEAKGVIDTAWSGASHDAPPVPEVAEKIKRIARGEEKPEWPPSDASPAWLAGREEAIADGPVGFNPHDEGTTEHADWKAGWEATRKELDEAAAEGVKENEVPDRASVGAGNTGTAHPEGTFELFQGIPGKEDFSDDDVEFLDAPALARIGGELIERCEEFRHLRGLDIRYFWKARGGSPNNKVRLGRAYQPDGLERQSLDYPVWVVWLAADNLRNVNDRGATKRQVEACLYRQLKHCGRTNAGKPTHAPYDFEGFTSELQRYGPWNGDLVGMVQASGKALGPEIVQTAFDLRPPAKGGEKVEEEDAGDEATEGENEDDGDAGTSE